MRNRRWPIGHAAYGQEVFNHRLHPGFANRPTAPVRAVISIRLAWYLPAVVEHDAQGMNVGEETLVGQALVARDCAVEQRHVRSLPEPPHSLHKLINLRLVDRGHARVACVQHNAADCPKDGLAYGTANIAEPAGILDEGVDVAAERETKAFIELPDAVPGHRQEPLPIEPGVSPQTEVVQVGARLIAKGFVR